jgi:hypothetical protein
MAARPLPGASDADLRTRSHVDGALRHGQTAMRRAAPNAPFSYKSDRGFADGFCRHGMA